MDEDGDLMKSILNGILTLVFLSLLFLVPISVNAESVSISGGKLIDERTMIPMRSIFEELGAQVTWDQNTSTITATKGNTKILLKIGSKDTKVNNKTVKLDVQPQVQKGVTLIPLRFVSEALGAQVEWNNTLQRAIISQGDKEIIVTIERAAWLMDSFNIKDKNDNIVELPNLAKVTIVEITDDELIDDWYTVRMIYKSKSYYTDLLYDFDINYKFHFENPYNKYNWSKDIWNDIEQGIISLGMTEDMVRLSWGIPYDINEYVSVWGTSVQWIYGEDIAYRTYLYFDDGVLTSWQD